MRKNTSENFPSFTLLCRRLTKQELLENSWPFIESAHSSGSSELLALLRMTHRPSKTPLEFEKVESWLMYRGHGVQPKVYFRSWPFPQTWIGLIINGKHVRECAGRVFTEIGYPENRVKNNTAFPYTMKKAFSF